jgi:hypothetical protein
LIRICSRSVTIFAGRDSFLANGRRERLWPKNAGFMGFRVFLATRDVSLEQEQRVNLLLPIRRIWKKTLEKGVKIGIKRNRGKKNLVGV